MNWTVYLFEQTTIQIRTTEKISVFHTFLSLKLKGRKYNWKHNKNGYVLILRSWCGFNINPIRSGVWDLWVIRGGGFHPPYQKPTSECLIQILFYTVNYTYIRSSNPKRIVSSFKTLDFRADQSSARTWRMRRNFKKSKIYKEKLAADFFSGPPKINGST